MPSRPDRKRPAWWRCGRRVRCRRCFAVPVGALRCDSLALPGVVRWLGRCCGRCAVGVGSRLGPGRMAGALRSLSGDCSGRSFAPGPDRAHCEGLTAPARQREAGDSDDRSVPGFSPWGPGHGGGVARHLDAFPPSARSWHHESWRIWAWYPPGSISRSSSSGSHPQPPRAPAARTASTSSPGVGVIASAPRRVRRALPSTTRRSAAG